MTFRHRTPERPLRSVNHRFYASDDIPHREGGVSLRQRPDRVTVTYLRRIAGVHPVAEYRNLIAGPWLVAWHRALLEALVDGRRVGFDFVVVTQVEGELHFFDVLIAEQGSDVGCETRHTKSS